MPVLKEQDQNENLQAIPWCPLNDELKNGWRIFARAIADDKAPLMVFHNAIQLLKE